MLDKRIVDLRLDQLEDPRAKTGKIFINAEQHHAYFDVLLCKMVNMNLNVLKHLYSSSLKLGVQNLSKQIMYDLTYCVIVSLKRLCWPCCCGDF